MLLLSSSSAGVWMSCSSGAATRVETSRPLALVYPRSSYQSAPLKAMLELFRIQVPKLYGL